MSAVIPSMKPSTEDGTDISVDNDEENFANSCEYDLDLRKRDFEYFHDRERMFYSNQGHRRDNGLNHTNRIDDKHWHTNDRIIIDKDYRKEETKSDLETLVEISNSISERVNGVKQKGEGGHDVRNLVQFVNSASYDIKAALDHTSPVTSPRNSSQSHKETNNLSPINSNHDRNLNQPSQRYDRVKNTIPYFGNRDLNSGPLKVLKVEPLNIVKHKESHHSVETEENPVTKKSKNFEISELIPSKKPKLESDDSYSETIDFKEENDVKYKVIDHERTESPDNSKTNDNPSQNEDEKGKHKFDNPLPLRKRRLPASFWQEPGKSENHKPPAPPPPIPSIHDTAFLPFVPRRFSFGSDPSDFIGPNLSASEKLEWLRLNSLEREHVFSSVLNEGSHRLDHLGGIHPQFPYVLPSTSLNSRRMGTCLPRDAVRLPPSKRFGSYESNPYHMCPYGSRIIEAPSSLSSTYQPLTSSLPFVHGFPHTQYSPPFWSQLGDSRQNIFPLELSASAQIGNPHSIVRPVPKKTISRFSPHLNSIFDVR